MHNAVFAPTVGLDADQSQRDILLFLKILYSQAPQQSYIGLSLQKAGQKLFDHQAIAAADHDRLVRRITQRIDRYNIFLRVAPLKEKPADGRGDESLSLGSAVLWADIDCSNVDRVVSILERLALQPTFTVKSGHGVHAYWLLSEFSTDHVNIKEANRALQNQINDLAGEAIADDVYDLARIMRVPGSINLKNGSPQPVKIIQYISERVYAIAQFPRVPVNETPPLCFDAVELPLDFLDTIKDRDKKLYARIFSEKTALKADAPTTPAGEIDNSRNDAYIVTRLMALGYSPNVCVAVLTHDDWLSGVKFQRTLRFSYVVRTINRAWSNYQQSPDRFFSGTKGQFQAQQMAYYIQETTPFLYTAGALWRYVGGVYKADGEEFARSVVWSKLGSRWNSRAADETVKWLQDGYTVSVEQTNQHENLINCQNGMLNITTLELIDHAQHYRSLAQIPITWNPSADTRQIDQFFSEVLPLDAISVFWEFVGSVFIRGHYWPKYFMTLVGAKDSGKSKVLEILARFFGVSNIKAIPFQALADNRFALISLFGKLANIFDDLNESEAQNTGQIKALSGDAFIGGEQKYGGYVEFKNVARMIFSANHFPPVKSPDDAFFSRALLIPCNNRFTNETADSLIVDKMTTPNNMSAILRRAVEGLQRLQARGFLELSPSIETMQAEYRFAADTVLGFYEATTQVNIEGYETKEQAWNRYKTWCANGGRKNVSQDKFFKRVAESADRLKLRDEYKTVDGDRVHCYVGRQVLKAEKRFILKG